MKLYHIMLKAWTIMCFILMYSRLPIAVGVYLSEYMKDRSTVAEACLHRGIIEYVPASNQEVLNLIHVLQKSLRTDTFWIKSTYIPLIATPDHFYWTDEAVNSSLWLPTEPKLNYTCTVLRPNSATDVYMLGTRSCKPMNNYAFYICSDPTTDQPAQMETQTATTTSMTTKSTTTTPTTTKSMKTTSIAIPPTTTKSTAKTLMTTTSKTTPSTTTTPTATKSMTTASITTPSTTTKSMTAAPSIARPPTKTKLMTTLSITIPQTTIKSMTTASMTTHLLMTAALMTTKSMTTKSVGKTSMTTSLPTSRSTRGKTTVTVSSIGGGGFSKTVVTTPTTATTEHGAAQTYGNPDAIVSSTSQETALGAGSDDEMALSDGHGSWSETGEQEVTTKGPSHESSTLTPEPDRQSSTPQSSTLSITTTTTTTTTTTNNNNYTTSTWKSKTRIPRQPSGEQHPGSVPVIVCPCKCPQNLTNRSFANVSYDDLTDQILRNLTLNSKDLSKCSRKKKSASDNRPTSQIGGFFAIGLLTFTFALLICFDMANATGLCITRTKMHSAGRKK